MGIKRNLRYMRSPVVTSLNGFAGWIDGAILRPFNSIWVILEQWEGYNEKMYATELRLRLKRSLPPTGMEPGRPALNLLS